jgi:hypothetical protein
MLLVLTLVAAAAGYLPARRASTIDPMGQHDGIRIRPRPSFCRPHVGNGVTANRMRIQVGYRYRRFARPAQSASSERILQSKSHVKDRYACASNGPAYRARAVWSKYSSGPAVVPQEAAETLAAEDTWARHC